MKRNIRLLLAASVMTAAMSMTSFAAGWQQEGDRWWYGTDETNTTYYSNGWQWIDGNQDGISECYYFDENGYLLTNTTTPDGYTVNGDGAWVVDGTVQTQGGQTASQTVPEKYPLRTTVIKEKYVNLLNKTEEDMFRVMGETEGDDIFGITQYTYATSGDRIGSVNFLMADGRIFAINVYQLGNPLELLNEDQLSERTLSELDRLIGGGGYYNKNGAIVWKISDEYPIYYIHDNREGASPVAQLLYGE